MIIPELPGHSPSLEEMRRINEAGILALRIANVSPNDDTLLAAVYPADDPHHIDALAVAMEEFRICARSAMQAASVDVTYGHSPQSYYGESRVYGPTITDKASLAAATYATAVRIQSRHQPARFIAVQHEVDTTAHETIREVTSEFSLRQDEASGPQLSLALWRREGWRLGVRTILDSVLTVASLPPDNDSGREYASILPLPPLMKPLPSAEPGPLLRVMRGRLVIYQPAEDTGRLPTLDQPVSLPYQTPQWSADKVSQATQHLRAAAGILADYGNAKW